jgi:hypothetical protein
LYVALTRARREIFHIEPPNSDGLSVDRASGRWVRRGFGVNRWRVYELEVVGSDSHAAHPAGTWLSEDDARSLQEYLGESVMPGDPVDLELLETTKNSGAWHYLIRHKGRTIGVTSDAFGATLAAILRAGARPPCTLTGLHVEMTDTVGGDGAYARRHGLGSHGIWERARVFGLANLVFETTGEH